MNVLVVNGGPPPSPAARHGAFDLVIAVDSGMDHARELELDVQVLVGDLDSISHSALRAAEEGGTEIERHPADKDATDLELALALAVERGAEAITVISGSHTERLDHLVAALTIVGSPRWRSVDVRAYMDSAEVRVVHPHRPARIEGRPGEWLSILALHGSAGGVTTAGLRFPLHDATLQPGIGLGVSNELTDVHACVSCTTGVLTVIRPAALRPWR